MNIQQLRIFVAVANSRNMSKTASKMHLTQPAISKSILSLQQLLGTRLIDRNKRELCLTPKGNIFYKHALKALHEIDDAIVQCSQCSSILSGVLNLQIGSASALMPRLLYSFRQQHPQVSYNITQNSDQQTKYDFRITYAPTGAILKNGTPLLEEQVLLAVPSNHKFAYKQSIDLCEAKDQEFLLLQKWQALRTQADYLCGLANFQPRVIFQGDNPSTLREMVSLGMGVTFVPDITWNDLINSQIHLLHITSPISRRYLCLYASPYLQHSPITIAFREHAIQYFKDYKAKVLHERYQRAQSYSR